MPQHACAQSNLQSFLFILKFTSHHSAATRCPSALPRLQGCSAKKGHGSALTALGALAGLRELHVHALGGCEAGALEAMLAGLTGLKALSLSAPTPAAAAPRAQRAAGHQRPAHAARAQASLDLCWEENLSDNVCVRFRPSPACARCTRGALARSRLDSPTAGISMLAIVPRGNVKSYL